MAVAGWSTRDMIDRYTGASASERAAIEARGLNLGICKRTAPLTAKPGS